ncbi:hypothetical protein BLA39750_02192 [Burkholderia lata]|uniref:DNA primase/polymerase bifunctional N-terminal domain-containing protein n=1 Tax=Burkholderia lata (strain ATCC 17760 / DSM 23089 / LMG 22485 / NCIMB 9086 / R18194 / 383) TaxID=482957 RepID=A0A6P2VW58_BURL3|nr:bifunctional DNA primase/polymerase [Burkholderia lata]VWC95481.1 hypothetical protein BLA39750_02192 [Burkholderia lata]
MTRLEQALQLASQGFYVFPIWPWEGNGEKDDGKRPAVSGWPAKATRDTKQLTKWWNRHDYNIGIATERFGDGGALVVVDVDKKNGKDGDEQILRLELEGLELPPTAEQSTPSGGRHLLYRAAAACKQGVDVLGAGLDIRSRGGFIVGPGSDIDGRAYVLNDAPLVAAPQWLVDRLGLDTRDRTVDRSPVDGVDPARAWRRAADYLASAPVAREGEGGDTTTYKVAAKLKDLGATQEQALNWMLEHWNDRCDPPWEPDELAAKVSHAFKYGQEAPGVSAPEAVFTNCEQPENVNTGVHPFEKLNREYAYVIAGGGHVLWETTDPHGAPTLMHLGLGTFHTKFRAQKIQLGKRAEYLTEAWIEWQQRRTYDGFVFAPGRIVDTRWYNLWRGFAVEPAQAPEHPMVTRFLEHALQNVCNGDKQLFHWMIGYFAHMVQKPWEKPLTALVFKGKKGTGKNALVERIGKLLGSAFLLTSKRRYLVSNFNGHFENCLCLTLDEAFWSGDKESEGILKDLITGAEHNIEHKGKESYKVANLTRVVIIGNEDWIVPASHDERRYAVFTMGEGRMQDREYFREMRVGLDEQGGNAHLLRYLLDFDLSTVDVNAAPATRGLIDQKHESLAPIEEWWLDCLTTGEIQGADFGGEWPKSIATNRLRAAFERWAKARNIRGRLPTEVAFGRTMKKIALSFSKKKQRADNAGDASYSFFTPGLDVLREDWDRYIGGAVEWEVE